MALAYSTRTRESLTSKLRGLGYKVAEGRLGYELATREQVLESPQPIGECTRGLEGLSGECFLGSTRGLRSSGDFGLTGIRGNVDLSRLPSATMAISWALIRASTSLRA